MASAREIISMRLRSKVEATKVTRDPFSNQSVGVMGEFGDPWWATHIMLNNISQLFRHDPDSASEALSAGLVTLGVILSAESIRAQIEDESNNVRLLNDDESYYLVQLEEAVPKGGSPPPNDNISCVLKRQKFVTIFSEGSNWSDNKERERRINVEFIPEAFAPHLHTSIFVGSMRGLDYPDSAVCACIGLANRLFEEFGCSQLHTLVLDAAHTFVVRDRPNIKMDEAFLGLLLCPADGDSLDLYREILGICGQTRRVVTWAGFVFEFAGKFDITNSKRLHIYIYSYRQRMQA